MNAEEKTTDCGENKIKQKKKNIPTVLKPKKNSYSTDVFPWKFIGFKDGDESQNNKAALRPKLMCQSWMNSFPFVSESKCNKYLFLKNAIELRFQF